MLLGGATLRFNAPGRAHTKTPRNCLGVGQTSDLPVHGASGSVPLVASKLRARGPANRQTGGLPHAPT
jgi:hypothetical protein